MFLQSITQPSTFECFPLFLHFYGSQRNQSHASRAAPPSGQRRVTNGIARHSAKAGPKLTANEAPFTVCASTTSNNSNNKNCDNVDLASAAVAEGFKSASWTRANSFEKKRKELKVFFFQFLLYLHLVRNLRTLRLFCLFYSQLNAACGTFSV